MLLDFAPLSAAYAFLTALFVDFKIASVMYAVKMYRIFTMWLIVSMLEKVFLENYLERVYIKHSRPPSFSQLVTVTWAIDAIALIVPFSILYLLYVRYKDVGNSYIIDARIMLLVMIDYLMSSILFVSVGLIILNHIQDKDLFRYEHDGMRAIRAGAVIFFRVILLVVLIPFYSIVI